MKRTTNQAITPVYLISHISYFRSAFFSLAFVLPQVAIRFASSRSFHDYISNIYSTSHFIPLKPGILSIYFLSHFASCESSDQTDLACRLDHIYYPFVLSCLMDNTDLLHSFLPFPSQLLFFRLRRFFSFNSLLGHSLSRISTN